MQNIFNKKSTNFDLSWFAKRYNALIVDFPLDIMPEQLANDDICSKFNYEDIYNSLKKAHTFLLNISRELLQKPDEEHIKYVLTKLDLIWALCLLGELRYQNNSYCLFFHKPLHSKLQTLPNNYGQAFQYIYDNGCYVEYFYNNIATELYKNCNNGILYFDDGMTALGLYLFVQKCAQKRWYWEKDKSGNYSNREFDPVKDCIEPYYRIDMRIFTGSDRLYCDVFEQLSGYDDVMINYFKSIYEFVKENHPECLPRQIGFYNYICCSIPFSIDRKHSMLGQIGVGSSNDNFVFYGALSGKVKEVALAEVDYTNVKRVSTCGDWFHIQNDEDVKRSIHVMKIKAQYGKNIFN